MANATTYPVGDRDEMLEHANLLIKGLKERGMGLIQAHRDYVRSTQYLQYPDYLELGEIFKDTILFGATPLLVTQFEEYVHTTLG